MGNTVTLEFAGDADRLKRAAKESVDSLDKVGRAAHKLDDDFGKVGNGIDSKSGRIRGKLSAFGDDLVSTLQKASDKLPDVLSGVVGNLPPQGQAIALSLVGGLAAALAPMIGAALTSAVLLAVGGGVLALGIMSALKDPKVAKAFDGLKTKAMKVFGEFGEPFKAPLIRASKTFEKVLDSLRPQIDQLGKIMAPVIDKLAPALGEFFKNVMPGITDAVTASTPLFDALAEHLPKIGQALSDFFTEISKHGDDAATFFGDMLTVLEWTIKAVGAVISTLTSEYSYVRKVLIGFKNAALEIGMWFKNTLWGKWIKGAWDGIKNGGEAVWNWLKALPGKLKAVFATIANSLSAPFRSAFNRISDAWNNTIGRLSWTVPGWVPGIGGNSIGAPSLPHFHSGGVVPGAPGSEVLAVLQGGEEVRSRAGSVGGGDMVHVVVKIDRDTLLDVIAKGNRRGGPKLA